MKRCNKCHDLFDESEFRQGKRVNGFCNNCKREYERTRRHKFRGDPIRFIEPRITRDSEGNEALKCSKCGEIKPLCDFREKRGKEVLRGYCRSCKCVQRRTRECTRYIRTLFGEDSQEYLAYQTLAWRNHEKVLSTVQGIPRHRRLRPLVYRAEVRELLQRLLLQKA